MAVVIVYWNGKYQAELIGLMRCLDATATGLTNNLLELLDERQIDRNKMIGFSGDTCSVMFGRYNSVTQKLKELNPHILTVKCACHSLHLCSSKACKMLPSKVDLITNIHFYYFINHCF